MVGKALRLLTTLGELPGGATLSELSRAVGLPDEHHVPAARGAGPDGFVELDEATKRYRLGLTIFALGQRVSQAHGFGGVALPIMQHLSAQTREASLMSVLDGDRQLYVHYVDGPQQVSVIGEPGKHGPIHSTAMGKVLIAFAPPAVREHLLDTLELPATGPNTITDRDACAPRSPASSATATPSRTRSTRAASAPSACRSATPRASRSRRCRSRHRRSAPRWSTSSVSSPS